VPPARRKLDRPLGKKRYRRLFVISTEGSKTEHRYFAVVNNLVADCRVYCIKGDNAGSPLRVLKRMQTYLKRKGIKAPDEAWLVVDKDHWEDRQLSPLHQWSRENSRHGLALSNPNFEYWLLLHYEDGTRIASSDECSRRLQQHIPNYDKAINRHDITLARINEAIRRAKSRDHPRCADWPRSPGGTTMYRLMERILKGR